MTSTDSALQFASVLPRRISGRLTPPTRLPWRRSQVFALAWLGYSSYRVAYLLAVKAVDPAATPSAAVRTGMAILDGALVGLTTLVLLTLGERFPVEKPYRGRNLLVHGATVLFCAIATLTILFAAGKLTRPEELHEGLMFFNLVSITGPVFAYLAIAAVIQAAVYQQRYRDRELDALRLGAQLSAARLESLRAKLHPHFLFNTLNGISDLIFTDPGKADTVVLRLARLLRASLDTVNDEISVRQELDLLAAYFEIERVRFGDRLRVTIDADRAAYEARIPPFLVQPLAENAIQHGIAPRVRGGSVSVRAHVRSAPHAHTLVLELADDGIGIPDEPSEGVGLRVTRERLETMYRGAAALRVLPRRGGGTIATIELPFAPMASAAS